MNILEGLVTFILKIVYGIYRHCTIELFEFILIKQKKLTIIRDI